MLVAQLFNALTNIKQYDYLKNVLMLKLALILMNSQRLIVEKYR